MAIIITLAILGWLLFFSSIFFFIWLIAVRTKNFKIQSIKNTNRFVLIMNVYQELAEFFSALKKTKLFEDAYMEHQPAIKDLYDKFSYFEETMWTVFADEDSFANSDLFIDSYETFDEEDDIEQ